MEISDLRGTTALVTGAASGIGRATAEAFGRRGAALVVCDRDAEGLAEAERAFTGLGVRVVARTVDVADRTAMQRFADDVLGTAGPPDILVNNAGVGLGARFQDTSLDDWDWVIDINLKGVVHGCHFFVPAMIARGRPGHVVNLSSLAGYVATQSLAAYATTKFAVLGLSEALREELAPHGIGVTAVCPGVIDTPITRNARMKGALADASARDQMSRFYQRRGYGPDTVARGILRAIERNRAVAPVSPESRIFYYAKRLAPGALGWLTRRMAARRPGRP